MKRPRLETRLDANSYHTEKEYGMNTLQNLFENAAERVAISKLDQILFYCAAAYKYKGTESPDWWRVYFTTETYTRLGFTRQDFLQAKELLEQTGMHVLYREYRGRLAPDWFDTHRELIISEKPMTRSKPQVVQPNWLQRLIGYTPPPRRQHFLEF